MPAGRPKADRQLPHCREVGMSCHECVANSAESLVSIAESLSAPMARQLFTTMYPAAACLPMGQTFIQIVRGQNVRMRKPVAAETIYAPAVFEAPLFQAAVA